MNNTEKRSKRPVFKQPLTKYEKIIELLAATGVLICLIILIFAWGIVPERIPTHFGASGMPDGWSGKEALFFLPIGVILLYLLLSVISRYPHTFNYPCKITEENAKVQYQNARYLIGLLKTEIIWSFAYIQWITIRVATGQAEGLGALYLPVFLVIIFGTIGVYFYKARKYK